MCFCQDWVKDLADLLQEHFWVGSHEFQPVRLEVLSALHGLLRGSPSNYQEELTAKCVLPYLSGLPSETDSSVALHGVKVVIDSARRAWHAHFNSLIGVLADVVRSSSNSEVRHLALSGLFQLQTAEIPHAAASPEHQQEMLVLLTGLLGCTEVVVRKEVLLFLLGQAAEATNPAPSKSDGSGLVSTGRNIQKLKALEVATLVDSLITRCYHERDAGVFEELTRGVAQVLQAGALVRPQHTQQLMRLVLQTDVPFPALIQPEDCPSLDAPAWRLTMRCRLLGYLVGYLQYLPEGSMETMSEALLKVT